MNVHIYDYYQCHITLIVGQTVVYDYYQYRITITVVDRHTVVHDCYLYVITITLDIDTQFLPYGYKLVCFCY